MGSSMDIQFYSELCLFMHLLTSAEVYLGTKLLSDLKNLDIYQILPNLLKATSTEALMAQQAQTICSPLRNINTSPPAWNWIQLTDSFHQRHHCCLDSSPHSPVNQSLSSSPLSSSITPSLFHSRLKTYFFNKYLPTLKTFGIPWSPGPGLPSWIIGLDRTYHTHHSIFSLFFLLILVWFGILSWLPVSLSPYM